MSEERGVTVLEPGAVRRGAGVATVMVLVLGLTATITGDKFAAAATTIMGLAAGIAGLQSSGSVERQFTERDWKSLPEGGYILMVHGVWHEKRTPNVAVYERHEDGTSQGDDRHPLHW